MTDKQRLIITKGLSLIARVKSVDYEIRLLSKKAIGWIADAADFNKRPPESPAVGVKE